MRRRGEIYHKARSEEEKASPMSHWFIPLILTKLSGRLDEERENGVSNGLDIRNKLRRRSNYIEGWTTVKSDWTFQARVNWGERAWNAGRGRRDLVRRDRSIGWGTGLNEVVRIFVRDWLNEWGEEVSLSLSGSLVVLCLLFSQLQTVSLVYSPHKFH